MRRVRDFILGRTVRWHTKHAGRPYCELRLDKTLVHDPDGCAHAPTCEVVAAEGGHWRWVCSCGSKGTRLCYKSDVERLRKMHLRNRHSVVTW